MADSPISFPSNSTEALALLYVQSQDLTGKSPSEIQTLFYEAYYELVRDYRSKTASGWFKAQLEPKQS